MFAAPQLTFSYEQIERFDADITVREDASIFITETITYNFGSVDRHGIYRYIPTTHPQESGSWMRERVIDINLERVARNGEPTPYELTEEADQIFVRIGDPNRTISGLQTYTIEYTVAGGLSYHQYEDAELYWNVTGTDWQVPIMNAVATVHDPNGIFRTARACYTGQGGVGESCRDITATTSAVTFTSGIIEPGEGFTVAQSLDSALVARVIEERMNLTWLWISLAMIWVVWFGTWVYRRVTTHDPDLPVIAQYEPYAEFRPMFTGVLIDDSLEHRDITAGLMDLAEQGFIHITQTEKKVLFLFETKDYEVTLKRDATETNEASHRELLRLLFGNHTAAGTKVELSDIKGDKRQQRENQKIVQGLKRSVRDDLVTHGFYEHMKNIFPLIGKLVLGFLAVGAAMFATGSLTTDPPLALFVLIGTAVLTGILLGVSYRRKTQKGYEAVNHLEGFKHFLSVTDKERFAFHNAPEKSPEQFMKYLPYAVAFGVEEKWAEVFKDISIPDPEWYSSTGGAHFSAAVLTSDLTSFSQTLSSSTTSSGSSGGGSVGGGAGGGGGGSW